MQIYRISTLFSGLVERVNEMRYANRQNAFDREAAHEAILNRINTNLPNPNPPERDLENNRGENADPLDVINGDEQDPDPLHQAGNNEDMLLGGAGENDDMLLGGLEKTRTCCWAELEKDPNNVRPSTQMRFATKFSNKHKLRQFLSFL